MKRLDDLACPEVSRLFRFSDLIGFDPFEWPVLADRGILFRAKAAISACRAWSLNPLGSGAPFLHGPSGGGKTALLWSTVEAIIKGWWRERIEETKAYRKEEFDAGRWKPWKHGELRIIYTTGAALASEIARAGRAGLDAIVEKYTGQSAAYSDQDQVLAFFDDLELVGTDANVGRVLYGIFDHLYQEEIAAFVTSNLSGDELASVLGDRVVRRIYDISSGAFEVPL